MREADLYHMLKRRAKSTMFKRIENMLEPGTPDVYFVNCNVSGWMEMKLLKLGSKFSGEVKIPFRPAQYEWLMDNYKAGGLSVLGIISDWGVFFAVNENIKRTYERRDFRSGSLLISPKDYNKFFLECERYGKS